MTRKPDSDAAREVAKLGIEIVEGDLNNEESLKRADALVETGCRSLESFATRAGRFRCGKGIGVGALP